MTKPFRFAVQSINAQSAKEWKDRARSAEGLGYSALHLADHLLGRGCTHTNHPLQNLAEQHDRRHARRAMLPMPLALTVKM